MAKEPQVTLKSFSQQHDCDNYLSCHLLESPCTACPGIAMLFVVIRNGLSQIKGKVMILLVSLGLDAGTNLPILPLSCPLLIGLGIPGGFIAMKT